MPDMARFKNLVYVTMGPAGAPPEAIAKLKDCPELRFLNWCIRRGSEGCSGEELASIPNLERLVLSAATYGGISAEFIQGLKNCAKLKHLELTGVNFTEDQLDALAGLEIEELVLSASPVISKLFREGRFPSKVSSLTLHNWTPRQAAPFLIEMASSLTNIRSLTIIGNIDDVLLPAFADLEGLEDLTLAGTSNVSDGSLFQVPAGLKLLDIAGLINLTLEAEIAMEAAAPGIEWLRRDLFPQARAWRAALLEYATSEEELEIPADAEVVRIEVNGNAAKEVQGYQKLKALELVLRPGVSARDVAAVLGTKIVKDNVEYLVVLNADPSLAAAAFKGLDGLKKLRALSVSSVPCKGAMDEACKLAAKMPALEYLQLSGRHSATRFQVVADREVIAERSLKEITKSKSIRHLDLHGITGISRKTYSEVAAAPSLKVLIINECKIPGDAGLEFGYSANLRVLEFINTFLRSADPCEVAKIRHLRRLHATGWRGSSGAGGASGGRLAEAILRHRWQNP